MTPSGLKASIIGLGDIQAADLGVASHVIDALCQERLGEAVDLAYLADESRQADVWAYGRDFSIVVLGARLGGPAGRVRRWNYENFKRNCVWASCLTPLFPGLRNALARTELAGGLPEDVLFLLVEPKETEGFRLSPEARRAVRETVRVIRAELERRGAVEPANPVVSPMYRLELLEICI